MGRPFLIAGACCQQWLLKQNNLFSEWRTEAVSDRYSPGDHHGSLYNSHAAPHCHQCGGLVNMSHCSSIHQSHIRSSQIQPPGQWIDIILINLAQSAKTPFYILLRGSSEVGGGIRVVGGI